MAKVTIDADECTGCGVCYEDECPDVFKEGADGTSSLQEKFRKGSPTAGEIPDNMKECAAKAADACPVTAIKVE